MAYTDVVTRDEAKLYMKVDDSVSLDNTLIDELIESALVYIERKTNYIVVQAASKKYAIPTSRVLRVYDFPINDEVTEDTKFTKTVKKGYTEYCISDGSLEEFDLDVGYADENNVPKWVKTVALILINHWYHDLEQDNGVRIPERAKMLLNTHKRFFI